MASICANCVNSQKDSRKWVCTAEPFERVIPEHIDFISGRVSPEITICVTCYERNSKGDCEKFVQIPKVIPSQESSQDLVQIRLKKPSLKKRLGISLVRIGERLIQESDS